MCEREMGREIYRYICSCSRALSEIVSYPPYIRSVDIYIIYISKGLQCALTAITIVALWHLGRGMCALCVSDLYIYI